MIRTKVRLGEHEIKEDELIPKNDCVTTYLTECNRVHQDIEIENVIIHPEYRGRRNLNKHDIAIIRLKKKVKRNGMLPIRLQLSI